MCSVPLGHAFRSKPEPFAILNIFCVSTGLLSDSSLSFSLAVVARKRPVHYNTVLSVLLDFHPNLVTVKGCHAASVQYSIRTALLGFLRCTSSPMIEVERSYFIVLFLSAVYLDLAHLLLLSSSLFFYALSEYHLKSLLNINAKYMYY